jgi:cytosine/adenosine deaminase-related metal-dependent hydrolase
MGTTVIRSADWVIAWDGAAKRHVYRRHIDVAFGGAALTYVGPRYTGPADVTIDGAERMVMPGLVNVHSHPGHEPAYRGIREEHGVRGMYMTGLFERSQAYALPDRESRAAATEFAYCELLKSGVTSVVDIGAPWDGWAELAARSGLRAFLAPGFASARWKLENEHELKYEGDEKSGRQRFEAALAFVDGLGRHPSGRLSGVLAPMQIDTCSEKLLRDAKGGADTTVWLSAASPSPRSGQLWHDRRARPTHLLRRTRTPDTERAAMWEWVRSATGLDDLAD